jgi:Ni/Fe-hydrogenase 1 B-type cytochrome subunit
VGGEASDHFFMGNIRLIHFIAAYVFAIGFAVRIYWALVGNRYAREIFYLPLWKSEWWNNLWYEIRFYLFLERKQRKTLGHNALAQAGMFFLNTLMTLFMIITGFALYGEGLGAGSWADTWFGWIIPMLGGGEATHNWHNMGMWIMLTFIVIHIYMAVRADMVGRQSSVSAIISGWRLFKDDQP